MIPKPAHLGPEYAAQFQDSSVVAAYQHRPPLPAETFELLLGLIADAAGAVLDAGCGTGVVARPLAVRVDRVDAVDWSAGMIEKGKGLPGGDHPNLRWICGRVEEAPLYPPYALVVAANCLHWMDWETVLPRFRKVLTPTGLLAVVRQGVAPLPWEAALVDLVRRFSTNRDYVPYDLFHELAVRGLFSKEGERRTAPVPFSQPTRDYIEAIHSQNGFSSDRMGPDAAAAFDAAVARVLMPFSRAGRIELQVWGEVVWGRPGRSGGCGEGV